MNLVVSAAEAKARLADCLRAAENGDEVVITRYGKAVAALVSPGDLAALRRLRAAGPQAGLAGLVGRWPDGESLAQELAAVVEARSQSRPAADLP